MSICSNYDPISASCAPTCYVCSHHGRCEREKEKAVDSVRSTANGNGKEVLKHSANFPKTFYHQ